MGTNTKLRYIQLQRPKCINTKTSLVSPMKKCFYPNTMVMIFEHLTIQYINIRVEIKHKITIRFSHWERAYVRAHPRQLPIYNSRTLRLLICYLLARCVRVCILILAVAAFDTARARTHSNRVELPYYFVYA